MPACSQPSRAKKRLSPRRVAWTLCLLACAGIVVNAALTRRSHRDWWDTLQSEQLHYAQWQTAAQREADALVGEVEGLSRQHVLERLTSRVGPDDPYPTPPLPPGVALMGMAPAPVSDPKVEPPLYWNVRSKNWCVIVPVYDGRAQRLTVTTLKRTFVAARAPQSEVVLLMNVMVAVYAAMFIAAIAAAAAWWLRWNHRPALHACLMTAVLGWAVVLTTDWEWGMGLRWRPPALGGVWRRSFWEGPALGLAFALLALRVPPRRPQRGVCAICGYDLTGNVSGICSECGTIVQPVLPAASAAVAVTR